MATLLLRNAHPVRDTAVWFEADVSQSPLAQGPVWVTRTIGNEQERLGEAETLKQAIEKCPELAELGDLIEMTYAGKPKEFKKYQPFLPGPPAAWSQGEVASENLEFVSVNGKAIRLDPARIKWTMIVHFDSGYGAFMLDSWCGWLRESGTDFETSYCWKPDADLADIARGYMLNLGLWPPDEFVDACSDVLSDNPDVRRLILEDSDAANSTIGSISTERSSGGEPKLTSSCGRSSEPVALFNRWCDGSGCPATTPC